MMLLPSEPSLYLQPQRQPKGRRPAQRVRAQPHVEPMLAELEPGVGPGNRKCTRLEAREFLEASKGDQFIAFLCCSAVTEVKRRSDYPQIFLVVRRTGESATPPCVCLFE